MSIVYTYMYSMVADESLLLPLEFPHSVHVDTWPIVYSTIMCLLHLYIGYR